MSITRPSQIVEVTGGVTTSLASKLDALDAKDTTISGVAYGTPMVAGVGLADDLYDVFASNQRIASYTLHLPLNAPTGEQAAQTGSFGEVVTITRAGTNAVIPLSTGEVATGANTFRMMDVPLGLFIEPTRTQNFVNPDAPATQTITLTNSSTYVLWIEGTGSITVAVGTATSSAGLPGTATASAPLFFTLSSASGTVVFTVVGSVTFAQLESGPAGSTDLWPTSKIHAAGTRNLDTVSVPLPTPGASWSIDALFSLPPEHSWGTGNYGLFRIGNNGAANSVRAMVVAGTMTFSVLDNASAERLCTVPTPTYLTRPGEAHRLTFCNDNGTMSVYIDGTKRSGANGGAGTGIVTTWPTTVVIGQYGTVTPLGLGGVISDFKVSRYGDPFRAAPQYRRRILWLSDSILNNGYMPVSTAALISTTLLYAPWKSDGLTLAANIDTGTYGGTTLGTGLMDVADRTFVYNGGTAWAEVKRYVPFSTYSGLITEYGPNETESSTDYRRAYDMLVAQGMKWFKRLVTMNPPPKANGGLTAWDAADPYQTSGRYAAVLAVAAKWNTRHVDLVADFQAKVTSGKYTVTQLMRDTVHPSYDYGFRRMEELIAARWNAAPQEYAQVPEISGRVVNYLFGQPTAGVWTMTSYGESTTGPALRPTSRLIGSDLANVAAASGAKLSFPAAQMEQVWAHVLCDSIVGGNVTFYVDRGTANEKSYAIPTLQSARSLYPLSYMVAGGLDPSVQHTVELQTTSTDPVRVVGVTYVGVV